MEMVSVIMFLPIYLIFYQLLRAIWSVCSFLIISLSFGVGNKRAENNHCARWAEPVVQGDVSWSFLCISYAICNWQVMLHMQHQLVPPILQELAVNLEQVVLTKAETGTYKLRQLNKSFAGSLYDGL